MRCVRFPGLRSYLDRLLDDVALGATGERLRGTAVGALVQRTAERLDYVVDRDKIAPEHIQSESRELLGWFRYFSREDRFTAYVTAVDRIVRSLQACLDTPNSGRGTSRTPQWKRPLLVHFRPTASLYRWRVSRDGTRIILPTPMIALADSQLDLIAQQMAGSSRSSCASESLLTSEYRRVAAELSAAGGVADLAAGQAHDLGASFERVNGEYFQGRCERPRLTWGARETFRKFGHYDYVQDLVMLSKTLDDSQVPAYVIDHVMHHELLHKKHGFHFKQGKRYSHLPAFRREERTFREYAAADRFLGRLSRSLRQVRC